MPLCTSYPFANALTILCREMCGGHAKRLQVCKRSVQGEADIPVIKHAHVVHRSPVGGSGFIARKPSDAYTNVLIVQLVSGAILVYPRYRRRRARRHLAQAKLDSKEKKKEAQHYPKSPALCPGQWLRSVIKEPQACEN